MKSNAMIDMNLTEQEESVLHKEFRMEKRKENPCETVALSKNENENALKDESK